MNYREKIQDLISRIHSIYDEAEGLRDFATLEEKKYWNALRKTFYDAADPLKKLDNSMTDARAWQDMDEDEQDPPGYKEEQDEEQAAFNREAGYE